MRHPFCHQAHNEGFQGGSATAKAYMRNVYERIRKQGYKGMPGDVKSGEEKRLATVRIRIQTDGKLEEDDTLLMEVFGEGKWTSAAQCALREGAPFREIPPDWGKPHLDFQFMFFYNLKLEPQAGCEP